MGQSFPNFLTSDRTFTIELSDAIFNELEGHRDAGPIIDAGEEGHAVVRATITQTASSAPPSVPDTGSTAMLLGLGLFAVAFARSRLVPTANSPSINQPSAEPACGRACAKRLTERKSADSADSLR
jgi:VPDSG-CTERM motif